MQVDELIRCVKIARAADVTLMSWGPGGVGKSYGYLTAAMNISNEEFGTDFKDIRKYDSFCTKMIREGNFEGNFLFRVLNVPTLDPTDLMGIPHCERGGDGRFFTSWACPDFIQEIGNGIILFDELPDGDSLTMKACYRIMLDHKIKEHVLGVGWFVCAAGNRPEDKGYARNLPAPLITRMAHIGIGCDAPNFTEQTVEKAVLDPRAWIKWAIKNKIRPEIVSYINNLASSLYKYQATPRTWEFVSRIIQISEGSWTDPCVSALIKGTIGEGEGAKFSGWLRLKDKLPNIDTILKKPMDAMIPEDLDVQHILCAELIYRITHKNAPNIMKYITRKSAFPVEMQSFFIQGTVTKDASLIGVKEIAKWTNDHPEILY